MATPTSNSVTAFTAPLSGNVLIDAMIFPVRWGTGTASPTALTYSFASAGSLWQSQGYSDDNEPFTTGVGALSAVEQGNARLAFAAWSSFTNIRFTEVADNGSVVGEVRVAYTNLADTETQAAHAYTPFNEPAAGDIWLNSDSDFENLRPGTFGFYSLLHEIGHTLGLKHSFEAEPNNPAILPESFDQVAYTVMAYDLYPDFLGSDYALSFYPTTPMPLDIKAMEYLYGPRLDRNPGNTIYSFSQGRDYFETIFDSGGIDTIVWNATTQGGDIDLRPTEWSALGNSLLLVGKEGLIYDDPYTVVIYDTTIIENATGGGGNDIMYGNDVANQLNGQGGHDDMFGYDGADSLSGGDGNDHLYGRAASGGPDGADRIDGGNGSDYLQGNAGNDTLDGGDGSDRINGGANDDLINGGAGNDTANGNLGNDVLNGGAGHDSLRGGQGNDSLSGGDGNDTLSGDLGADTLSGGAGLDLFSIPGATSLSSSPDRIVGFADGDRIALGFAPTVLAGPAQASAMAAMTAAQQLLDGHAGNGELAAIQVGSDTYIFFGVGGGATVDSAIIVAGVSTNIFDAADFA